MRLPPLTVWDGVFSPSACHYLHTASSIGGLGDEQHTVFHRAQPPRTPLESALHSVLVALGDDSPHVEYWWRDEWENIDAHSDVDEYLFEDDGVIRYPDHGHVLYLNVGEKVRGPTVVWEPAEAGEGGAAAFGRLTSVPACTGRLLRFRGECMHAVPRPPELWFECDLALQAATEAAQPEVSQDPGLVRSVVLFNTWQEAPHDVDTAPTTDPLEAVKEFAADFGGSAVEDLVAVMATPDAECQPYDRWQQHTPRVVAGAREADPPEERPFRVRLMGSQERHNHAEASVRLLAPSGLVDALTQPSVVTSFAQ
jgi:hypothetical protein